MTAQSSNDPQTWKHSGNVTFEYKGATMRLPTEVVISEPVTTADGESVTVTLTQKIIMRGIDIEEAKESIENEQQGQDPNNPDNDGGGA